MGWLLERAGANLNVVRGLYLVAYATGGYAGTRNALASLVVRTLDVNGLMIVAAVGAAMLGDWAEGAVLLFLFSLSDTLQIYAMGQTERAVRSLMQLRPDDAELVEAGATRRVHVDELAPSDIIRVRPGERVAVDGVVVTGTSSVDQAAITGESMPVDKGPGQAVYAGTINGPGVLDVRVTRRAAESTLARIVALVFEAREQRAPTQRLIDRFGGRYAWAVIAAAVLMFVIPTLALGWPADASVRRAITLLVVASPCALVISTPASYLSAIANAARNGVLVKGGAHLEALAAARIVAVDKTGTLTRGEPRVTDVVALDGNRPEEVLEVAAAVEQMSEHPLARAVSDAAAARGLTPPPSSHVRAVPGLGVQGMVNGQRVRVGRMRMMAAEQGLGPDVIRLMESLENQGKTTMLVSDGRLRGVIAVADVVQPAARDAIRLLHQRGLRVAMITGDNELVARAVGQEVGVDETHAGLLPEDKVDIVRHLSREAPTAVVGDGVNDAPALAASSVGIAMGSTGSDVALETADVVLMGGDLSKLPYALELGRRARAVVAQNIAISIGVIAALVIVTIVRGIPLPLGVLAHEGSTVVVVLNGLRLLGLSARASADRL
jgi:Cd2+/Zn2+-exporting ATPase